MPIILLLHEYVFDAYICTWVCIKYMSAILYVFYQTGFILTWEELLIMLMNMFFNAYKFHCKFVMRFSCRLGSGFLKEFPPSYKAEFSYSYEIVRVFCYKIEKINSHLNLKFLFYYLEYTDAVLVSPALRKTNI